MRCHTTPGGGERKRKRRQSFLKARPVLGEKKRFMGGKGKNDASAVERGRREEGRRFSRLKCSAVRRERRRLGPK